jgi:DNA-binding MarR family transcriptional regulator
MKNRALAAEEYRALAEFRFLIRRYLNNTEQAARSVGLEPQQYQGLLALRGLPPGQEPTIRALAERLQIRHHSAVELVDRMEKRGLFRRTRSKDDRREVLLQVTARGERLLSRLVRHRMAEMAVNGPELARSLRAVLSAKWSAKKKVSLYRVASESVSESASRTLHRQREGMRHP